MAYIDWANKQMFEDSLKDVYVTDHTPKPKKYTTLNKKDDMAFFNYYKSLEEYNQLPVPEIRTVSESKYERGSLMQKILDPFDGSRRLENGALFYEVVDKELRSDVFNEEKLRS